MRKINLHIKEYKLLIVWLSYLIISSSMQAQEVFIGGNNTMPVLDAETYQYKESIQGFSSQTRWVQASSDGNFIYTGTIYFQPELNLYKIDATTHEIIHSSPVPFTVQDLEISGDDQYLFHHNSTTVYKVDTDDLMAVDSFNLGKIIRYIEIYDENTIYASSTERIYKLDFTGHTVMDSVVFDAWNSPAELIINQGKTKLYSLKSSMPNTIYKIELLNHEIEMSAPLTGSIGMTNDLIFAEDGSTIYVSTNGNQDMDGSLLEVDPLDLSISTLVNKDPGSGVMSFDPDGDLWIPNNTSNSISVYDPANHEVVHAINTSDYLGGPFMVAFSEGGSVDVSEETKTPDITVFPVPAKNHVRLNTHKNSDYRYMLLSISGETKRSGILKNYAEIDLTDLPEGIYIIRLYNETENLTKKVVKE
ncbi:MAG: T9SS type A sorting domain-containing protein [Bacteroidales bacterium]|nr:T9SS type A sorting domain-containing protein [Bacteroidales bacterium]MCF8386897.1 T9SS type A sorting domain-containing protein [Bacteroidales bacterium]MCF8399380.1 T9SS type A sorting domain-containing protein [Bacteroidales bacterium]